MEWTIEKLLSWSTDYLHRHSIPNPRLDSEILLAHILETNRIGLYLDYKRPLTQSELNRFKCVIKRRICREPVHYITGRREFWSLEFKVNRDVLIPRPETEVLVEKALNTIKRKPSCQSVSTKRNENLIPPNPPLLKGGTVVSPLWKRGGRGDFQREFNTTGPCEISILDLGTGCGNIAISLAKELDCCTVVAVDRYEKVLSLASENARDHGVSNRIEFLKGDLFTALNDSNIKRSRLIRRPLQFDIIISNPPYIPSGELENLSPEIRDFEPLESLDGGEDGLDYYRRIVKEAPSYLKKGGYLLMEIGARQGRGICDIIKNIICFGDPEFVKDYSGIERVVVACKRLL